MKKFTALLTATIVLTGCVAQTDHLGADVYDEGQLNSRQEARTVKILSISPAKVAVDNKAQKQAAQTFGAILGGVAGAIVGYQSSAAGTVAGTVAGGAVGAAAGQLVKDKVIVEGVSLSYSEKGKIYTSTQAGRRCQFQKGTALLITTKQNETRIQPNAECPADKK